MIKRFVGFIFFIILLIIYFGHLSQEATINWLFFGGCGALLLGFALWVITRRWI